MWNYRIIHFKTDIGDYYDLHEVYYHEGIPFARTTEGKAYGETPEEVIEALEMMLKDAKNSPVMEDDEIDDELGKKILGYNDTDGINNL